MSWTRFSHGLPPGPKACAIGVMGNGVAMTSRSRHPGIVNLLLGDGSARPVTATIDPAVWKALGTIAGGEAIPGDSY
jgi:hypothetical protein